MRYGILNGLKETQREIARNLGISRSYVSRIEKRAVNKLIREINKADKKVKKQMGSFTCFYY